ncbi:hypothetical protein EBQ34_05030 [Vandammella animalimorsus]|uniref:Uncharacterized protein n=1 Tax=Vandammella animalimorsus TaxID=2029117 RepID=A0A3M6RLQ4_9BURK|nr:hypothetical protein [Vandammella animalimorsus]RMX15934.1 hypothetical protein EBQ34_05030 [Vandammella animalimorsus]
MPFDDDPPPTPASQALRAWHATLTEATRSGVRPDQGVFTQAMPPLAASARARDFLAAEWEVEEAAGHIEAQKQDSWFHDVQTRQALSVAPNDDEAWSRPVAEVAGDRLAVYAAPEDMREGCVARWVDL